MRGGQFFFGRFSATKRRFFGAENGARFLSPLLEKMFFSPFLT